MSCFLWQANPTIVDMLPDLFEHLFSTVLGKVAQWPLENHYLRIHDDPTWRQPAKVAAAGSLPPAPRISKVPEPTKTTGSKDDYLTEQVEEFDRISRAEEAIAKETTSAASKGQHEGRSGFAERGSSHGF